MITNKTRIFSSLLVLSCTFLILTQCSSKKYYADFKRTKKGVDNLILLSPYVSVEFLKNKEISKDNEQEEISVQKIVDNVHSLFKKKYQLTDFILPYDTISEYELSNIFSILDNGDNNLEVPIPLFIQNRIKNNSNRYFLMVCFKGYYNAHFQPNYRTQQMLATNRILIYPNTQFFSSDMRVLIFDNQKNIIVYYGKKYAKNIDPRIIDSVEKMILDILKPLYYK